MRMMNFHVDETLEVEESKEEMESTAFLCDLCEKGYKSRRLLSKHKGTHQQSDQPCNLCSKTYKSRMKLQNHINNVHGEKIQCNQCDKLYSSKRNWTIHQLNAHQNNGESFKICSKTLSITNLKKHEDSCQVKFLKPITDHYIPATKSAKSKYKC